MVVPLVGILVVVLFSTFDWISGFFFWLSELSVQVREKIIDDDGLKNGFMKRSFFILFAWKETIQLANWLESVSI